MTSLSFIGLGLNNENGISIQGMDIAKKVDIVMIELYTNLMPELDLENLSKLLEKEVKVLKRSDLEENAEDVILKNAHKKNIALLVPGDPMVATTHVALRIQAEKAGIRTRVIHSASIISAVAGATGLQVYKFGRTVTIPFNSSAGLPESLYSFISENEKSGSHTLALLDIDTEKDRYMKIDEAIEKLLQMEKQKKDKIIDEERLAIGLSNIGSEKAIIKAAKIKELLKYRFDSPPFSIVLPGKLHFMEKEALITLCNASKEDLEG